MGSASDFAHIPIIDVSDLVAGGRRRADRRGLPGERVLASVHAFEGTYGDYLLGKVGKVYPGLQSAVL